MPPLPRRLLTAFTLLVGGTVALPAADLALEMAAPPSVSGTGPFDHAAEI